MKIIDYVRNIFRREKIYLERFNIAYERGDLQNAIKILKKNEGLVKKIDDGKLNDLENFILSSLKEDSYEKSKHYKKINPEDIKDISLDYKDKKEYELKN